jgi:tetratricopeptide (TPR) repeat protein
MRPWGNRGHVRRERGELDLAVADLSKALELRPAYDFARFRRAQCYLDLGKPSEAEADLEEILRQHPEDAAPRAMWAELRTRRGAPSELSAMPAPRDAFGLMQRGAVFAQNGELSLGLADYDAAYALLPQPIVRAYRGQVHEQLGHFAEARADFEAYLEVDPNNEAIRAALARVRGTSQP